jgi:hypothetical protein
MLSILVFVSFYYPLSDQCVMIEKEYVTKHKKYKAITRTISQRPDQSKVISLLCLNLVVLVVLVVFVYLV